MVVATPRCWRCCWWVWGSSRGLSGCIADRFPRRGGRRSRGVRIASGSGRRSRGDRAQRMPRPRSACRQRWGLAGFARLAGWDRVLPRRCRVVIFRSPSVRRSRCCVRRTPACGRLRGAWGVRRRPSRGRCGGTHPRGRIRWSIERRWRSGMLSAEPGGRRQRSWSKTIGSASTSRTGCPARSRPPEGESLRDHGCRSGRDATNLGGKIADGRRAGARSRSPTG